MTGAGLVWGAPRSRTARRRSTAGLSSRRRWRS